MLTIKSFFVIFVRVMASYLSVKALIALVVMMGVVVGSPLYFACVIGIVLLDILFLERYIQHAVTIVLLPIFRMMNGKKPFDAEPA